MTEHNLDQVDFGAEMMNEMAESERRYRTDVWYQALITEGKFEISKNEKKKGLQFRLRGCLLEREGDDTSVNPRRSLLKWLVTPWDVLEPAATEMEATERKEKALSKLDMMTRDLFALLGDDDMIDPGSRDQHNKGGFILEDGTKLTREERKPILISARKKAWTWAEKRCKTQSGQDFVDCAPYIRVEYEEGSDFPSIAEMRNSLPPGAVFTPASQAFEVGATAVAEEPKAKKKAAKKGKRK